jgi:hypothetical protein
MSYFLNVLDRCELKYLFLLLCYLFNSQKGFTILNLILVYNFCAFVY